MLGFRGNWGGILPLAIIETKGRILKSSYKSSPWAIEKKTYINTANTTICEMLILNENNSLIWSLWKRKTRQNPIKKTRIAAIQKAMGTESIRASKSANQVSMIKPSPIPGIKMSFSLRENALRNIQTPPIVQRNPQMTRIMIFSTDDPMIWISFVNDYYLHSSL